MVSEIFVRVASDHLCCCSLVSASVWTWMCLIVCIRWDAGLQLCVGAVFGDHSGTVLLQVSSSQRASCFVERQQKGSAGLRPASPPGSVCLCLWVHLSLLKQYQYLIITWYVVFRCQRSSVWWFRRASGERSSGGQRSQEYMSIQNQSTWGILPSAATWELHIHSKTLQLSAAYSSTQINIRCHMMFVLWVMVMLEWKIKTQ